MDDIVPKICTRYKQAKPLTEFYLNVPAKNRYSSRCKVCLSEIDKARRASRRPPVLPVPDGHKHCHECGGNYPATEEYFFSNKSRIDGLAAYCKPCWNTLEKARRATRQAPPVPETLKCIKCGEEKPATIEYFYAAQNMFYGLQSMCRQCRNAETRSRYYANEERRARLLQQGKERHKRHREQRCAYLRQWQRTHREYCNAQKREYRKRESVRLRRRIENHTRRARLLQAPGKYTKQDILDQHERQRGKCYWCKTDLKKETRPYHVDHVVPLSRGGTNWPDNLVIACHVCNESKNNRLPHEWPKGGRLL